MSPPRNRLFVGEARTRVRVRLVGTGLVTASFWSLLSSSRMIRLRAPGRRGTLRSRRRWAAVVVGELERPLVGGQDELAEAGELEVLAHGERGRGTSTTMPSTGSNVVGARVEPRRRQRDGCRRRQRRCRTTAIVIGAAAAVRVDLGHPEELGDAPVELDEVAGGDGRDSAPRQNTNRPSDVVASPSTSASSSCTKKPSSDVLAGEQRRHDGLDDDGLARERAGRARPLDGRDQRDRPHADTAIVQRGGLRRVVVGGERDRDRVGARRGRARDVERAVPGPPSA